MTGFAQKLLIVHHCIVHHCIDQLAPVFAIAIRQIRLAANT